MATLDELRSERIRKLTILKDKGINPYPTKTNKELTLSEVAGDFSKLSKRKKPLTVIGRIMAIRSFGGSIFIDLYDGTGTFQVYLKKDEIGDKAFRLFTETIDIGDFIEATGSLFVTKKKEKSLLAVSWRILSKSLRPLPEKWHGLQDVEERFRRRYLDIVMSPVVRDRFIVRSKIIEAIRTSLNKEDFIEVETPMLQTVAGGATARPFVTHHNALDVDLSLRIAPELFLKELLVAGYSRVYELGRSFRNEGIDVTHNPEFTTIEAYAAYETPETEMARIEKLINGVVTKVLKKKDVSYGEEVIHFSKKFAVVPFAKLVKQYMLIGENDLMNREVLSLKAKQFGISPASHEGPEKILDNIYKKIIRPKIIDPTFIVEYPAAFSPLAKRIEGKEGYINRFQLVIGGTEIVNGFAELNDPLEQEARFVEQEAKRKEGDEEAQIKDMEYIEALEHGMPPATGWGLGIDRLVMLLTDTKNIREVIIFPTLRPK